MATNHSRKFRGIAAPVFVREPLLVRLCTKFVDNLTLFLRNAHYDDCVKDPSRIYVSPYADPDDTGQVTYDAPVLYARLDAYTNVE